MKKLLSLFLAFLLLVSLSACAEPAGEESQIPVSTTSTTVTTTNSRSSTTTAITTTTTATKGYNWREFIAEYDAWVDDYIDFMKKYKADPTNLSLLTEYAELATEMTNWSERADEIEVELTATETAEYSAELLRIAAKLAEAAY